jgi:hypothetical protein
MSPSTPSMPSRFASRLTGRLTRSGVFAALLLAGIGGSTGCLDRPVTPASPRTSNAVTELVPPSHEQVDVLFAIDSSASMADKQAVLAKAVPDLIGRLVNPRCLNRDGQPSVEQPLGPEDPCPRGTAREHEPVRDLHVGIVTSALGSGGADACRGETADDGGRLVSRGATGPAGYLTWSPTAADPAGAKLVAELSSRVLAVGEKGCAYESQMEGWYRFLVEPNPPAGIEVGPAGFPVLVGTDHELLQERADFLRPGSLLAIVVVSDEDEHSTVQGALPDLPICSGTGDEVPGSCWPIEYHVEDGYGADGHPFPAGYVAQQESASGSPFHLFSGTAACDVDPYSADCAECTLSGLTGGPMAAGCHALDGSQDPLSLRQWNPKARFGWDPRAPVQRYVDGLTKQRIFDRDGRYVDNPLLREHAADRIFLATIVGVPWQDIARVDDQHTPDLSLGYMTAAELGEKHPIADGTGWDLILGTPYSHDASRRKTPLDPLMIDRPGTRQSPRLEEGTPHPVTGQPLGFDAWNDINGREWDSRGGDLEYACVFELPEPRTCTAGSSCDCDTKDAKDNPLCQGEQGDPGSSVQRRAKAYPGTRFLEIQRRLGEAGGSPIVASICAKDLSEEGRAAGRQDYGYRPAMAAIADGLKKKLKGPCLPRAIPIDPIDGSSPCVVLAARYPAGASASREDVDACKRCDGKARAEVRDDIEAALTGEVTRYECVCEVPQLQGEPLAQCKSDPDARVLDDGTGGWCYVDPSAPDQPAGGEAIVSTCGAEQKRTIRLLDTDTRDAALFVTCLGSATGGR